VQRAGRRWAGATGRADAAGRIVVRTLWGGCARRLLPGYLPVGNGATVCPWFSGPWPPPKPGAVRIASCT